MWVFVHLIYIIQFQNRLLVMLQWAWLYITFDRSARLITGKSPLPLDL
jgi:NADH dehydrogenase